MINRKNRIFRIYFHCSLFNWHFCVGFMEHSGKRRKDQETRSGVILLPSMEKVPIWLIP